MDERLEAVQLANRVLDRPMADPDDDLAVLARNLLRVRDLVQAVAENAVLDSQDSSVYHVDFVPVVNAKTYLKVTAVSAKASQD